MKSILVVLVAFSSLNAFAATQLSCKVGETLNQGTNSPSTEYTLTAPLAGDNGTDARIDTTAGKVLSDKFGVETFISKDIAPGKPIILISATDKNGTGTSAVGENSAVLFFDTTEGSLYLECHLL